MLGRQDYTAEEIDSATSAVETQLAAYEKLIAAIGQGGEKQIRPALEDFEAPLFNNLTMMLDRHLVHRVRKVTGKDCNQSTRSS